ncbi:37S ribosomal protein S25, mitochondrial [Chaetomium sp. MPI-SDFR-AT-0129]|nr:37S ribosomal protein S25, mitochondrial [Chaetomium sp. MPI-SDFR-AT-0129]
MVRGRKFTAAQVYNTARARAGKPIIPGRAAPVPPAWVHALRNIPPAEVLTRPYPVQHAPPPTSRAPKQLKTGVPRNMFRPQRIVHPEDQLRQEFFRDHPWELARPRLVVELDGLDGRRRDWGRGLRQPGMALSGESVVQRQLYLIEVTGLSKEAAYDQARKEFYKLRQQEQIERRVAVEEARMYGAYFGKNNLQVGMQLEDASYDRWLKWAGEEIAKVEAMQQAAYANVVDVAEGEGEEGEEEVKL